jgi:hypothetical protein
MHDTALMQIVERLQQEAEQPMSFGLLKLPAPGTMHSHGKRIALKERQRQHGTTCCHEEVERSRNAWVIDTLQKKKLRSSNLHNLLFERTYNFQSHSFTTAPPNPAVHDSCTSLTDSFKSFVIVTAAFAEALLFFHSLLICKSFG